MSFGLRSSADGWRGRIGASFTPDAVAALTACVVETLAPRTVLITHDGRTGGIEATAAAVASCRTAGVERLRVVTHLPTPVATRAVTRGECDVALLVTASHNPPADNGLKVKVHPGGPPELALEHRINELYATRPVPADPGTWPAVAAERPDRYVAEHIAFARPEGPLRPLRVVVDGLGGIAGEPVARLAEAFGWRVHRIGCVPDAAFGGLRPDPALPASRRRAAAAVTETGADLGIVLDGDGDRVFLVDDRGETVAPHDLLALLIEYRHRTRRLGPGLGFGVTVSTGTAVRSVASELGRAVLERPIGFKHLAPLLAGGRVDAAGGSVGDLAFTEYSVDRDPFTALGLVAQMLSEPGTGLRGRLAALHRRLGPLRWFEAKVPGTGDEDELAMAGRDALAGLGLSAAISAMSTVDGVKFWLDHGQWLLLRPSTTESGVRLYGELLGTTPPDGRADRVVDLVHRRISPRWKEIS